ncbi:MAG TPA: biopolymer transporter ExbD [Flavobacteriaceae bacterium]|nr:biopolymer transporter ExbD [Flavobacteriaceae bacterium]
MNLRGRNKISSEFSMASMTDIIFLLLVFFLLTSPAITPEALDLLLPNASGKTTNVQNVSISINKEQEIFLDNEMVNIGSLESLLKAKLEGVENPTIILRTEKSVPIQKAVTVMDIANKNRYKLVLAVKPE